MTPVEIHTNRLNHLVGILKKHRDGKGRKGTKFDMKVWAVHPGDHRPAFKEGFCGTSACALGHAAMDPTLHRAGLHLRWRKVGKEEYAANVYFHGAEGIDAAEIFFGLTNTEACLAFGATEKQKPEVVNFLSNLAQERAEVRMQCSA